ncbi:hypothetical protein P4502_12385 [Peribacillus frigoritolerans]|uniref:hypothetical protein n=1 Tax=Peribacillus frigoritolerans TaxID=450367 RepID=UPI002E22B480|nr:hypothetical protein [Peribacillus frigoritolerans]
MGPSSFGLSMVEDFALVLKQQQLEELQEISQYMNAVPNFHIYMIVRRPRIIFDSVSINNKYIIGKFKIQNKDTYESLDFQYEHHFKEKNLSIECEYPYDQLYVINQNGRKIFGGYASLILQELNSKSGLYQDNSEVIYIGQSFGTDGNRTAPTRLINHSTLQKIYSENTPDRDIWITLWSFTRNELMFLSPNEDGNHSLFIKYLNYIHTRYEKISTQQEINFTEAALIRYFQPKYNDKFKYTFPSKSHSTYSQCYTLGLDYVAVEIDTKRLNMNVWSETKPTKQFKHNIMFSLNNKQEIKDFFRIK